jgi:transcriptional regulator with XRE-family HTH domain
MTMATFREHLAEAQRSPEYWAYLGVLEFLDGLVAAMDAQRVNSAELARRMGTSRAWVSRVLRGESNLTFATMSKLALALDMRVTTQLAPAVDANATPERMSSGRRRRAARRRTA